LYEKIKIRVIFFQIAKNSQAELTTSKTTECDLNENATLDDENSSTESVDILYDNLTLRMKKSDAEALPQKDEKTSHNNEKMTQDEENNFDDKHESVEEESNSCSNTNEVNNKFATKSFLSCLYRNYLNRRRVEVCLCFARA
jgi:hypothetical protein